MEFKNNSLIKEESISGLDKYLNGNNAIPSEIDPQSQSQTKNIPKKNPIPIIPKAIPLVIYHLKWLILK